MTEPITAMGMSIQFLVESEAMSVFRFDLGAGGRVPAPHSHDGFEETIYCLDGAVTWTVDGVAHELTKGDAVVIPRGAIHGFAADPERDASMLCIAAPGVFKSSYFREMFALLGGDGPPDMEAVMAVMRRHGLTPAVPARS